MCATDALACDVASHCVRDRPEAMVRPAPFPALERQRLDLAEAERRFDTVEADRDVCVALLRAPRLIADVMPVMTDRALAPGDDHALGGVEVLLDILVPIGSAADVSVPPDSEALGFQGSDERRQPSAILGLVGHEHVRWRTHHCSPRNAPATRL